MDNVKQSVMTTTDLFIGESAIKEKEKTFDISSNNDAHASGVSLPSEGTPEHKHDDVSVSEHPQVFSNEESASKRQRIDVADNGFVMPSSIFNEHSDATEVKDITNSVYQDVVNNTINSETDGTTKIAECKIPEEKDGSKPFTTLLKNMSKDGEDIYKQYIQIFSEVEQYESISVARLEKLLQDAKNVERNLLQQREQLRQGVQQLSETFRLP